MLNFQVVFARLKKQAAFAKKNEADFRIAVYKQEFTPSEDGTITPFIPRAFPNGGVILRIASDAMIPGGATANNRSLYALDFQYNGGEALVIDGPILASALLGGDNDTQFPAKEIIVNPTQAISCRAQNRAGISGMVVHVAYHVAIDRYAG
jgi:hypothetical protein